MYRGASIQNQILFSTHVVKIFLKLIKAFLSNKHFQDDEPKQNKGFKLTNKNKIRVSTFQVEE